MSDAYNVTADELKQFVERYEQFELEKQSAVDDMKDLKAELKGRGFDVAAFLAIIALRKKDADDVAEFEAILELYKNAMGM